MAGFAGLDRSQRLGQLATIKGFQFGKPFLNVRSGGFIKPPFFVQLQHVAFEFCHADDRGYFLGVRWVLPARRGA